MIYYDASQPGTPEAGSEPPASADAVAPGSGQPTSGNVLSGEGGAIVGVTGPGGSDSTFDAEGNLVVQGQYGTLTIDAQGNYTYVPNPGAPEGVQDVFTYTIADSNGAISTATLTIAVGGAATADAGETAGPGNVINLPAGVDISDIRVSGNDLIITLPDGSQMTIPNGALFVPRLVSGDIEISQTSLAALLVESEPESDTGSPPSSGGNFGLDAPPLDPGVPLGDLVPPTEPDDTPPEEEEIFPDEDTVPTVLIFTPDSPAGAVNATAQVDESGLPARIVGSVAEPEGTEEPTDIETVNGTIVLTAEDGLASITINGVVITAVGQQIVGANGILTITSISDGEIGFSYTVTDNTTDGVNDFEDFTVVVTDVDGDTATGTLHIDIADDEPVARDDTDTVGADEQTASGNVMTGVGTTSGAPGADTVGADNATLTAVSGADGSDSTFDSDGNLVVHGQYGTLTIDAEGNYTYV
ncbi:MAG: Ig-like domain-containing protein, partial [Gammaproteobacteria bacterium]